MNSQGNRVMKDSKQIINSWGDCYCALYNTAVYVLWCRTEEAMIHSRDRVGIIWEPYGVPVLVPFSHMWLCPDCSGEGKERGRVMVISNSTHIYIEPKE